MSEQNEKLESACRKQAISAASALRQAATLLRLNGVREAIEGDDMGKTYINTLTAAILATLKPAEKKANTLTLNKPKVA